MPREATDTSRERNDSNSHKKGVHLDVGKSEQRGTASSTLMVRNLYCVDFDENDLESHISDLAIESGFSLPIKVTIPLDKTTGQVRGYAFIEFPHIDAARQFMSATDGFLRLNGGCFPVSFSHRTDDHKKEPMSDWQCQRCDFLNFAHRRSCKRCEIQRISGKEVFAESENSVSTKIDERVARVLEMCPGLIPDGSQYYTDDPDRLWLFDPDTLYWFEKRSSSYYRQLDDCETVLRRVDKRGHFVGSKDVPLPARTIAVRGSSIHDDVHLKGKIHTEVSDLTADSNPIHYEESLGRVSVVNPVESTVCNICARKFKSVEDLRKHENLSDLHERNLKRKSFS